MTSNSKTTNTSEIILNGVLTVLNKSKTWTGTMTSLSEELSKVLSKKEVKLLPTTPSALRHALNKVVSRLRNRRVSVKFIRTNDRMRTRCVKFLNNK